MYKHTRIKHSDIQHKCVECDFTHTFPTKVKTHHRMVHLGFKRQSVDICRRKICNFYGTRNCTDSKHVFLSCDQCDYSSKWRSCLKIHIRKVHDGEIARSSKLSDFQRCTFEDCLFQTQYKCDLKRHVRNKHEGIVKFKCDFMNCNFGTNLSQGLKEHTENHSTKPQKHKYKCHLCDQAFTQKAHLKAHTVKHTGEKAYKCHLCDQAFSRNGNKERHVKSKHEGIKKFSCAHVDCTYRATDKPHMKAHNMKHTG